MGTVIRSADELHAKVGQELGTSDWLEVTQERVNQFAEATGDHQWIHVDPARAKDGPFGGCIAHGYLSLALAGSYFLERMGMADLSELPEIAPMLPEIEDLEPTEAS